MNETLDNNYLIELEDFPCYFVGVDGVYSEKRGRMKKLKSSINNRYGYYVVDLYKDGKKYTKRVHRLIAKTFIPNPHNLPHIDHINHNRQDNRIENLRWVSRKDNNRNQSMSSRNTSGIQGVRFDKRGNNWIAQWNDNQGKHKAKSFSINKYGDNAKQLAIDYRKKMVDMLYNRV
jgi:hypothetical protein